jgi:hypothetical protein
MSSGRGEATDGGGSSGGSKGSGRRSVAGSRRERKRLSGERKGKKITRCRFLKQMFLARLRTSGQCFFWFSCSDSNSNTKGLSAHART